MAAEGKPIIFVTPLSENLKKLKDTINSDEAYSIYEVESASDYAQMAPAIGASLTISSDIKKLAKILSENKKLIKKFNCKVLLLHDQKLPLAVSQKLEKLGLNEVLYEPIIPKTLLYKVSLLAKSLKNPIVKDTSDVVLKSKNEAKPEGEVKLEKEQANTPSAEKKVSPDLLTAAADQNIEFDSLTQKADSKVNTSKNLSVTNDPTAIDNKMDLSLETKAEESLEKAAKKHNLEEVFEEPEKDSPAKSLGLMEDLEDAKKAPASAIEETLSEPKRKKHLNVSLNEEQPLPREKNIPEEKAEARKKLREKISKLPPAEREKAEKTLQTLELMEAQEKAKAEQVQKAEKATRTKEKLEDSEAIPELEKTPQQKLEEKREKLRKLKQMSQEAQAIEESEVAPPSEENNFDEMPELSALDEAEKEKAAKAIREKKIKALKELTRKKNEAEALSEVEAQDFSGEKLDDLPLEQVSASEQAEETTIPKKKRKKVEAELSDHHEKDKDYNLQLMDDDEKAAEERSQTEEDANNRKKDYDLALSDDDEKSEDEKSDVAADGRKRDKDYDLALADDDRKKKKRHVEEAVQGEGFKVKKPELDNNWDYDNIGKEDVAVVDQGEAGTLNYSEFKEYQESSAINPGAVKRKRKVFGENENVEAAGDGDSTGQVEEIQPIDEENLATSEETLEAEAKFDPFDIEEKITQKTSKEIAEVTPENTAEAILKKQQKEAQIINEIEMRAEEIIAQQEKDLGSAVTEELKKAARLEAMAEVLAKKGKEYTPDKIEEFKKKHAEAIAEDIYQKKKKENVLEKAEVFNKKAHKNTAEETTEDASKTATFDTLTAKKLKMAVNERETALEEKTKTQSFYAPDEEKTKTKSFYKDDGEETVIRYGKKGIIEIPKDKKVALVTEEEIILERPYVHHDTKGLEYIAGVRTLHYWEIFAELKILEFVASKIMISKNALTTFYFKDPKTNVFELVYSGHQECLEVDMYTGKSWEQFEIENRHKWEQTTLPTWQDPLFKQDQNFFIFPFFEQDSQLGFAVISLLGQVRTDAEAKIIENILSASRCYFLLRHHEALGIEIVDKVVEEMIEEHVETISILAKVKGMIKGIFGFFKKAA